MTPTTTGAPELPGLMQEHPLLISSLIEHAAEYHGRRRIVAREADGTLHVTDYAGIERRARRLAAALADLGVRAGDRVATLAMNNTRHLECFYGISGMGAVLHTVNPRLFPAQIAYIIDHGGARVLCLDAPFLPLVESLLPGLSQLEHLVVLDRRGACAEAAGRPLLYYEELLAAAADTWVWPQFDERAASCLCYTSGTTGAPKGVLYSHRSTVLHALASLQADFFALRSSDVVLPMAPMFHVNAWSTPYGCAMAGAQLVLPGHQLDGRSLADLIRAEGVTFALGVPTVWTTILEQLRTSGERVPSLKRALVGGAALPAALRQELESLGVRPIHAWGMTETSPIGTLGVESAEIAALPAAERTAELAKQGRPCWGFQLRVSGPDGAPAPRDGVTAGALSARGHWVASAYFRREEEPLLDAEGWFPTGDVASIDRCGCLKITDRTKDIIKSGGEWISSIDIENAALSCPGVRAAAAIAAQHPKWGERPVLIVVPLPGHALSEAALIEHLRPRMAKWSLPDAVLVVDGLPLTATGKVLKARLRELYGGVLCARN